MTFFPVAGDPQIYLSFNCVFVCPFESHVRMWHIPMFPFCICLHSITDLMQPAVVWTLSLFPQFSLLGLHVKMWDCQSFYYCRKSDYVESSLLCPFILPRCRFLSALSRKCWKSFDLWPRPMSWVAALSLS